MNGEGVHPPVEPGQNEGWSRRRLLYLIGLAVAAHLALVFIFGTRKEIAPLPVAHVSPLGFASRPDEALALDDPTLFALPHANDFGSPIWLKMPVVTAPTFTWTEPPRYLKLAESSLGTAFTEFMKTNPAPALTLDFKPGPQFTEPAAPGAPVLPERSTLRVVGPLAARPILNHPEVSSVAYNDVIPSSLVQVLVDRSGYVISVVLLESSSDDAADDLALEVARKLRFTPGPQLTVGKIIFGWHTVPLKTGQAP